MARDCLPNQVSLRGIGHHPVSSALNNNAYNYDYGYDNQPLLNATEVVPYPITLADDSTPSNRNMVFDNVVVSGPTSCVDAILGTKSTITISLSNKNSFSRISSNQYQGNSGNIIEEFNETHSIVIVFIHFLTEKSIALFQLDKIELLPVTNDEEIEKKLGSVKLCERYSILPIVIPPETAAILTFTFDSQILGYFNHVCFITLQTNEYLSCSDQSNLSELHLSRSISEIYERNSSSQLTVPSEQHSIDSCKDVLKVTIPINVIDPLHTVLMPALTHDPVAGKTTSNNGRGFKDQLLFSNSSSNKSDNMKGMFALYYDNN